MTQENRSAETATWFVDAWRADRVRHRPPAWRDSVARYQHQALASAKVQVLLGGLWDGFRTRLLNDLNSDSPALAAAAQGLIEKAGRVLVTEVSARNWLNAAAEAGCVALVRRYRGEVGRFIEQQLAQWTKEEMSSRIELAIGRDLQFIRINGTIVGGLAGLLIYAITVAM